MSDVLGSRDILYPAYLDHFWQDGTFSTATGYYDSNPANTLKELSCSDENPKSRPVHTSIRILIFLRRTGLKKLTDLCSM